jgi:hypothetical protein
MIGRVKNDIVLFRGFSLAFFNLKDRASRKAVIHEYKIKEKSMAQADPN